VANLRGQVTVSHAPFFAQIQLKSARTPGVETLQWPVKELAFNKFLIT
jgi:hypothetical protein